MKGGDRVSVGSREPVPECWGRRAGGTTTRFPSRSPDRRQRDCASRACGCGWKFVSAVCKSFCQTERTSDITLEFSDKETSQEKKFKGLASALREPRNPHNDGMEISGHMHPREPRTGRRSKQFGIPETRQAESCSLSPGVAPESE
jgi:hypothetical protein